MLRINKINYLKKSLIKFLLNKGRDCPSCGSSQSTIIERKYIITALKRCNKCFLLFRSPTTSEEENKEFYP